MANKTSRNLNAITNARIQAIAVKLVGGDCSDSEINALMSLVMPKLRFYIWSYIRNDDDTNDVLLNTMEKIWGRRSLYKPEFKFTTWAFHIARNESLEWINKRRFGVCDIDDNYENISNIMVDDFADVMMRESAREDAISDVYEEIQRIAIDEGNLPLLEKDINKRKFTEIADTYNMSENTAKTRVFSGRREICKALSRKHPERLALIFDF